MGMDDHVVVDVEIAKTVKEAGGWGATDRMGIGVAVVYEHATDRFRLYDEKHILDLRERLWVASRVTGYNIWNFDFPVIWGVSKHEWQAAQPTKEVAEIRQRMAPRTDDILRRIWQAKGLDPDSFAPRTHGGWKLDDVASATLGCGKSGSGEDAPIWFQAGNWAKLCEYCIDDVRIERDLGVFIDRYHYVRTELALLPVAEWSGL